MSEYYDIKPICYSANMDRGLRGDRNLTEDEMLERAIQDVKSANRLGCKVMREQFLLSPAGMARLAPYAEAYDVKVGIEIHNPETPYTPVMQEYFETFQKTGSAYLGFVPDFGMFATKPNKPHWDAALAQGGLEKHLELARELKYQEVPQKEAMARLREAGAAESVLVAAQGMYNFVQFKKDCTRELENRDLAG
ncbi:MAG: hypothetical protein HFI44_04420 [Lachnospiraceae bacterium]|nr:hypothetical protein [Lachnospiraceae bacterium]